MTFPLPEAAVSPALPPIEYLKDRVKKQLKQILVRDVGARVRTDAEDVHQMRVAIRRLRAFLRAARPMLAMEWAEHLREELGWLGDVLGKVRDLDVLLANVRDERGRSPLSERHGLSRVLGGLERERRAHWATLRTILQSGRYLALLQRVEAAANSPVVADPDVPVEEIARAEFKKLRRAVRKGGTQPSDAVLHRIRIKGKRARYAAELAETRRGKPAARFIRRVKDLQDLLGDHHDAIVVEQRLRTLIATDSDGGASLNLEPLMQRLGERRREVRKKWPKTWARVNKCGRAVWD